MSSATMNIPSIWDQSAFRLPDPRPMLRGIWRGVMKMAEAQYRVEARRGLRHYL